MDVSSNHVRAYLLVLKERGLSGSSRHAVVRSLKAMYNFLVREEWLSKSPMEQVGMPKRKKKVLDGLSEEQVSTLLDACLHARDEAIILFLVDTGLRASELVSLNVGDCDVKSGSVFVRNGKGGKQRHVYIGVKTRKALTRYLMGRKKAGKNQPLWISLNSGQRLTRHGLYELMKRLKARTGTHCNPHMFRRTFAIWSLRNGMNIYMLQKLMGHSDLEVLRRYLHIVQDDLEEAHQRFGAVDNTL